MGPVPTAMQPKLSGTGAILPVLIVALALLPTAAPAQSPDFDFGDGRHGSFTLPPGETTIQDLWSQVRTSADPAAYDPAIDSQVPSLENLTVSAGGTLTVSAYSGNPGSAVDPTLGGVLRLKVRGALTIEAGGAISTTGKGYRGGTMEGAAPGRIGQQGDSWGNGGGISGEANRGGGGGGFGEINSGNNPGSGGGGGHREAGARGATGTGAETGGLGGAAYDTVATALGQSFRDAYPLPRFGSGGGRGGQVENFSNILALGGNGGGVIIIEARQIVNNGAIRSEGAGGGSDLSGGGGGAGGSVLIQSTSAANGTVSVAGGAGGVGTVLGNDGGAGGMGIDLWDARFEVTSAVDGQGSVAFTPGGGLYDENAEVEVAAVPEAGWRFDHWEGDLTGPANPEYLTMDGSKSVTAFFVIEPSLSVTPAAREVGPSGGNLTFNVTVANNTDAIDWTATVDSGADFITITSGTSGTNAGPIAVSVAQNMIETSRTGTITVSSADVPGDPVTVTINQGPATPTLSVTPSTQTADAEGGELVIQVRNAGTGTFDWTATVLAGQSFASITSGGTGTNDGTFVVTLAENLTALQRNVTISITAPGALNSPVEIAITQQAGVPLLQATPSSQVVGSASGTASVSVNNGGSGTMNWTAAVVSGAEFASIASGSSGTDSGLISLALQSNTSQANRTATIRVESVDAINSPVEVSITQTAQETVLQVTPDTQTIGSEAGSASFQVDNAGSGTMNWTASVASGANFLSLTSGTTGTNAGTITVAAAANTGTEDRTGTIRIEAPGAANSPQLVTLVQTSRTPVLRIVPAEQSIGSNGGAINITIENGGTGTLSWTASLDAGAEFLTITSATNGSNDGSIQVTVTPNAENEARTGTVRIEAPGAEGNPQTATILQLGCKLLEPPVNLAASDGAHPDSVELIWSAEPGAQEYEVFRSPLTAPDRVELIGTSTEPRYSDTQADAPDYALVNRGCFNPGEFIITYVTYFYEIRAVNACGTSEASARTTGYRGLPPAGAQSAMELFTPDVLPAEKNADGQITVRQEDRVSVRLSAAAGIDAGSVWGQVNGEGVEDGALLWLPLPESGGTDGWVVFTGLNGVTPGTPFTLDAGARTLDGESVAASQTFYREDVATKALSDGVAAVPYVPAGESDGLFLEGRGDLYQITPAAIFDEPQLIQIPLPESAAGSSITLYYYGANENGANWYPADQVAGWLAAPVTLAEDGQFLEAWVNHGGIVRLGTVPAPTLSASMPGLVAPGDYGTMALLLATGLVLGLFGRRKAAARRT